MMVDVAAAVDDLQQLVAKADALAHASEDLFERVIWGGELEDRRQLERIAHLIGATAEAVEIAVEAGHELAALLAKRRSGD